MEDRAEAVRALNKSQSHQQSSQRQKPTLFWANHHPYPPRDGGHISQGEFQFNPVGPRTHFGKAHSSPPRGSTGLEGQKCYVRDSCLSHICPSYYVNVYPHKVSQDNSGAKAMAQEVSTSTEVNRNPRQASVSSTASKGITREFLTEADWSTDSVFQRVKCKPINEDQYGKAILSKSKTQ